jgi:hypothetical protein
MRGQVEKMKSIGQLLMKLQTFEVGCLSVVECYWLCFGVSMGFYDLLSGSV